jgi:hypothetical protein
MAAKTQRSITLEFSNNFAMSLYFRQQHKSGAYFVELVENDGSIQNGGSKSDFLA